MLKELLHKLTLDLGKEYNALIAEDKDVMHFKAEPDLTISFKELQPGVLFFTKVGKVPTKRKEEFFSHVMHANLLGQGTGGATLGMTHDEKFLTLLLIIDYEINQMDFKERVEEFANFTLYWREELERFKRESEESVLT